MTLALTFHIEVPQHLDPETIVDALSGVLSAYDAPHRVTEKTMIEITKTLVPDDKRLDFLPNHFGVARMIIVEGCIYKQMASLSRDYGGGFWDYYELSNGGCFMAPSGEQQMHLGNPDNYSDETMSSEAAGIVACLYVFSKLSFDPRFRMLGDKFHQLREFALQHPEAAKIFALID